MKIRVIDFNLQYTIESGQFFGYKKQKTSIYSFALDKQLITIRQSKDNLFIDSNIPDLLSKINDFFDLNNNISELYKIFEKDLNLTRLLKLKGLRIIKQNPWDAIGSFIISSNNNIKRIQQIWHSLAEHLGENKILFPTPEKLTKAGETYLRRLGLGFRAEYLKKTSEIIYKNPGIIDQINNANYESAKEILMEFPGVGPKIADCVLLFGFQKYESFPIDIWISRIMSKLYFNDQKISNDEILSFAKNNWGMWAGYVQQYLYHGARIGLL